MRPVPFLVAVTLGVAQVGCGVAPKDPHGSSAERVDRPADATDIKATPTAAPAQETLPVLDDPRKHGSDAAVIWPLTGTLRLPLSGPIPKKGGVVCWVRPAQTGGVVAVEVTIDGQRPRKGLMRVAGSGWRRVWLPDVTLEGAQGSGTAEMRLQAVGAVPPGAALSIAGLRVVADASEITGPSLGEDDLLASLDWNHRDLGPARQRLQAGDRAGALAALVAVVRRPVAGWSWPAGASTTSAADRILRGEVSAVGLTHTFPGGEIDWLANPTTGSLATSEWVWSLNRHASWTVVADAYRSSRQPTYVQGWAKLMRSWVRQAPAPAVQFEKAGSVWRDLEAGVRLNRFWLDSFNAVRGEAAVSDADILLYLRSIWDHGTYLTGSRWEPSNHCIIGQTGLFNAGSQYPWFTDASLWRRQAAQNLQRSLEISTLSEGAWYEMAPGYHQWVCTKCLDTYEFALNGGFASEIPPLFTDKVRRMAEWGLHLMGPTGEAPRVNDGGPLALENMKLERAARLFPESDLLAWGRDMAAGKEGKGPAWTSERLPDSGYAVMRTGWGSKDSFVMLDTGPMGGWHGHQDALNLVAWYQGRFFLHDNGGFKYDSSAWRKWGPTTAAHNTVLVDGMGQIRTWNGAEDPIGAQPAGQPAALFGTSSTVDYASGWYVCGYGPSVPNRGKQSNAINPQPATHRREVLLLKSLPLPVTVVLDTMTPADGTAHRYEVRWHLKTTTWTAKEAGAVTWTSDAGQPNLAVVSLGGEGDAHHADSGVTQPELLGWWYENQTADPAPALTLRRQRTTAGVARIVMVLVPVAGDPASNPVEEIRAGAANTWTLRVRGLPQPLTLRVQEHATGPQLAVEGFPLPEIR